MVGNLRKKRQRHPKPDNEPAVNSSLQSERQSEMLMLGLFGFTDIKSVHPTK
jgi:hypothetical protein